MFPIGFGRALFALSLAALAALSFVYGDFSPLLAPFPGPKAFTYVLGAILIAACIGLLVTRTLAASAIVVAVYAVAWAVLTVPPILHGPLSIGSWYGLSEAASLLVGVWTLFALYRDRAAKAASGLVSSRALRVTRILFGGACLVYGCAHFAYADYSMPFVPEWLPARMSWVYVTGVCHVAAGVGLILGICPRCAARLEAIMILLFGLLVWIPSHFAHPVPKWAGSAHNQWSETFLNFLLAAVAWLIADSLRLRKASPTKSE